MIKVQYNLPELTTTNDSAFKSLGCDASAFKACQNQRLTLMWVPPMGMGLKGGAPSLGQVAGERGCAPCIIRWPPPAPVHVGEKMPRALSATSPMHAPHGVAPTRLQLLTPAARGISWVMADAASSA